MNDRTIRACGLSAVVAAVASVALAPLNALARMQTESGRSDAENSLASWWAEPALAVLGPRVLDFADADTVYLTYGKFYAPAVLAVLACVLATRSRRPSSMNWSERWGWRLTITGYTIVTLGMIGYYWLTVGEWLYGVVLFGMLLGIPGSILLGIGLLRAGFHPRFSAWVILLDLPLKIALVSISTQALGMWPMMLAWGVIGWSLVRATPADENTDTTAPTVRDGRVRAEP
jgi:hypothetical protein